MASTLTTPATAEHVRQQMRAIRRELGDDVEELVGHAEDLLDWRYYVRRHPWAVVGVATCLGYFLVPRRNVVLPTDEGTLAQLAERIPLVMQREPETKKLGLIGSLLNMGTNLAMRAVLAYVGQQVGKLVGQQAADSQPVETQHHG